MCVCMFVHNNIIKGYRLLLHKIDDEKHCVLLVLLSQFVCSQISDQSTREDELIHSHSLMPVWKTDENKTIKAGVSQRNKLCSTSHEAAQLETTN